MANVYRSIRAGFRLVAALAIFGLAIDRPALGQTPATWLGGSNVSWATTGNWSTNAIPGTTTNVIYSGASANLVGQLLGANRSVNGITVGTVSGSVTIASGNTLTIGNGGVDMSAATGDFTVFSGAALTGTMTLDIASNRNFTLASPTGTAITLTGSIALTGGGTLTLAGNNYTTIAAGSLLRVGSGANLTFLAGNSGATSQSVSISGTLINDGGAVTANYGSAAFQVGRGGVGTNGAYVQNSGTSLLNAYVGSSGTTVGSITIKGGTSTMTVGALGSAVSGTGNLAVTGGSVTISSLAGVATGAGAVATITLTGGTTTLNAAFPTAALGTGATSTFTFDGGVYRAGASVTILQNLTNAYITNNGALIDSNGFSTTIAQVLSNGTAAGTSGGLTKLNTGTLALTAANTYTGTTTINAGVLQLGSNGTTGSLHTSSVITGSAGATLAFNRTNTATQGQDFNSVIGGAINVAQNGTGTVVLNGANSYAGTTSVNAGILQFANTNSLYSGSSANWSKTNITTATNATFAVNVGGSGEFTTSQVSTLLTNLTGDVTNGGMKAGARIGFDTTNASGTFTLSDAIADTNGTGGGVLGVTKLGSGVLSLTGTSTFTGPITVSGGTLQIGGSGKLAASYSGTVNIASGAAFVYASDQAATMGAGSVSANSINGSGDFIVRATNGLFTANNNGTGFTGGFYILSGTVSQGQTNSFGNATVYLGDTTGNKNAEVIGNANGRNNSRPVVVQDGNTGTSTIGMRANGTYTQIGAVTLNRTANFLAASTSTLAFTGGINGVGGVSLTGNVGTVKMSGSSTYSGTTSVNGGLLNLAHQFAAQNSTLNVTSGTVVFDSAVTGNAFTAGGLAGSGPVTLANNAGTPAAIALTVGKNDANTTYSGTLSGGGSLVKIGSGRLILSASSSFSGGTTLSDGSLEFASNALGSGNVTLNSGTLRWASGNTQDISNRLVLVSGSTATFDTNSNTVTLGTGFGSSTSAALTKTGSGTLVLNGANTYTGATTVNAGTLQAASNALANTSSIAVNGAYLSAVNYNSSASFALDATGSAAISGAGLSLGSVTNNNTTTNALDFTGGTGTITLASLSGPGNTRFQNHATITGGISQGTISTAGLLTASISGGSVTTGSLSASSVSGGSITTTGAATITTLSAGSISASGVATITTMSGGTAGLNGASASITTLSGGRINLSNNVALSVQDGTFGGTINGAGSLTKASAGRLLITGSQSYTGRTIISGGTLALGASASLASSPTIVVGNAGSTGAVLDLSAQGGVGKTVTFNADQKVMGKGTIDLDGATLRVLGTLAPGNSPGNLAINGNLAWQSSDLGYQWEINDATGAAGANWDLLTVTGVLDLSALSSSNKYLLDLTTLTLSNAAGEMANYVDGDNYTWSLVSASSVLLASGTAAAGTDITSLFNLSFANWANTVPSAGNYSVKVANDGTGINLVIVPEPDTIIFAGIGIAMAGWSLWKRRRIAHILRK